MANFEKSFWTEETRAQMPALNIPLLSNIGVFEVLKVQISADNEICDALTCTEHIA